MQNAQFVVTVLVCISPSLHAHYLAILCSCMDGPVHNYSPDHLKTSVTEFELVDGPDQNWTGREIGLDNGTACPARVTSTFESGLKLVEVDRARLSRN